MGNRFTEAGADTCVSPSDLRLGQVASELPFVGTGVIYGIFTSRYTRADTAPLPYAEDLFQKRHHWSRTGPHNRRVITSGEIGTNAMHPPGKRLTCHRASDINTMCKRSAFQCGRAQRICLHTEFNRVTVNSMTDNVL